MKRSMTGLLVLALVLCFTVAAVSAQRRGSKRPRNAPSRSAATGEPTDEAKGGISSDPRMANIQKDFVRETARLAQEYEKKQDIDGARNCYEQILLLMPEHPGAKEALDKLRQEELNADSIVVPVHANKGPQDTHVNVIANRPITIHAEGSWTFRMERELTAKGMQIPDELRDFDLGALVGIIHTGEDLKDVKPFLVGEDMELIPEKSGRLLLFMFDNDYKDNTGRLNVEIRGTFNKGK